MNKEIFDKITESGEATPVKLVFEAVSNPLATPSIKPTLYDTNVRAWLYRISTWGKLKFEYYDPEKRKKTRIDKNNFIKKLTDQDVRKMFGKLNVDELDINKIVIWRDVMTLKGKKDKEKFFVTVDLKKELKIEIVVGKLLKRK